MPQGLGLGSVSSVDSQGLFFFFIIVFLLSFHQRLGTISLA